MDGTQPRPVSLWTAREGLSHAPLRGDSTVDVAVVGGGGGDRGADGGLDPAGAWAAGGGDRGALDGAQTTGGSSAKITAQHSLIYRRLTSTFSEATARAYADANAAAVEWIGERIARLGTDCSYERHPAYVFTNDAGRVDELREEAETAAGLGFPVESVSPSPALPHPAMRG